MQVRLTIKPAELSDANEYVGRHHRHHKPTVGHRFSLSVWDGERLCGVAIIGRPVARKINQRTVLEVTRLCTDGTPNACSALYAAAARVGKEMGYESIQTYILESEAGTSLKASGWVNAGPAGGGQWKHTGQVGIFGSMNRDDQPTCGKVKWTKTLNGTLNHAPSPETTTAK